ncbi:hypothetical protein TBLA_0I01470 [Henningerozyma blattae CBS 6284]|uniref:Uncharacterized protein n=1 Tax=Henningerozyma blattae (strain ATCC 34711 / CBS 6284 / DSM 70876 / NBRC 10599 / NRRL Y-10934 / UCD 77-7) TaxID=1071380 RepID=I2H8V4_HENB6|nr:hypothetical protein TBLA_0I01470 [Tetrapisispora blattae CBS 6284]CCH62806.1 hypothetical protein TBLA_0I01470 [Tetrapisispora blattae CBS 6284]
MRGDRDRYIYGAASLEGPHCSNHSRNSNRVGRGGHGASSVCGPCAGRVAAQSGRRHVAGAARYRVLQTEISVPRAGACAGVCAALRSPLRSPLCGSPPCLCIVRPVPRTARRHAPGHPRGRRRRCRFRRTCRFRHRSQIRLGQGNATRQAPINVLTLQISKLILRLILGFFLGNSVGQAVAEQIMLWARQRGPAEWQCRRQIHPATPDGTALPGTPGSRVLPLWRPHVPAAALPRGAVALRTDKARQRPGRGQATATATATATTPHRPQCVALHPASASRGMRSMCRLGSADSARTAERRPPTAHRLPLRATEARTRQTAPDRAYRSAEAPCLAIPTLVACAVRVAPA